MHGASTFGVYRYRGMQARDSLPISIPSCTLLPALAIRPTPAGLLRGEVIDDQNRHALGR